MCRYNRTHCISKVRDQVRSMVAIVVSIGESSGISIHCPMADSSSALSSGMNWQIRPDEPSNMASLFAVESNHAPQSVRANDEAPLNISAMSVTLDTSHF